jgi:hypothetical protein
VKAKRLQSISPVPIANEHLDAARSGGLYVLALIWRRTPNPVKATKRQNPAGNAASGGVERTGIEPVTFGLQSRRSPS